METPRNTILIRPLPTLPKRVVLDRASKVLGSGGSWCRVIMCWEEFGITEHECIFFRRLIKVHKLVEREQFVVFENIYECLFIPICTRKIILLVEQYFLIIDIKKYQEVLSGWLSRSNARVSRNHAKIALSRATMIGYLWLSLIIDQLECIVYFVFCAELYGKP